MDLNQMYTMNYRQAQESVDKGILGGGYEYLLSVWIAPSEHFVAPITLGFRLTPTELT